MENQTEKTNYLKQAWLVLLLSLCFGASLAGIQVLLKDKIDKNKMDETLKQVPELVPGSVEGKSFMLDEKMIYQAMSKNQQIGWIIPAKGQGFADQIELLIGVNLKCTKITGLYVLDQKETPGLGNKIIEESWRKQFIKKDTGSPFVVTKANEIKDNEISAITGATISSDSVCSIVNRTLGDFKNLISNYKENNN